MIFVSNLNKDEYENFVKNNPKSHFMQSYAWGEFALKEKKLISHYVGLKDNDRLVATALMLEKKLPFGFSYFYIPRGFILDYNDFSLIKVFTSEIKKYIKKYKAIFFKLDPDIIYHSQDYFDNELVSNNDEFVKNMKKIGYKHLGFTKNFETSQPRYSFRIDMNNSLDTITDRFSKTTKQRVKKADDLGVSVKIGDSSDIKTFYDLMILTENRKDFITHNLEYYEVLYDIWNRDNKCYLFLGSVDLDSILLDKKKLVEELEKEYSTLFGELSKKDNTRKSELDRRITKLKYDIDNYEKIRNDYSSKITLSAHFIITYADKAWVLYAGNHNILTDTYTNYKTYSEHINYCFNNGIKLYDQFGTIGDLRENNPLLGLHEFKKKFGGDYVEFTGEYDYVLNKFMYFVFTKLVPIYRKTIKNLSKWKRKRHSN